VRIVAGELTEQQAVARLRRELEDRFHVQHITLQSGQCGPDDCGNDCD